MVNHRKINMLNIKQEAWPMSIKRVFLLLALVIAYFYILNSMPHKYINMEIKQSVDERYIMQRMKYHGISGCECDGNQCWFYREGVKCKL